jgi:peptide methionine sulfoxide reductase MsrB
MIDEDGAATSSDDEGSVDSNEIQSPAAKGAVKPVVSAAPIPAAAKPAAKQSVPVAPAASPPRPSPPNVKPAAAQAGVSPQAKRAAAASAVVPPASEAALREGPWPTPTADEAALLDDAKLEARGGKYYNHFVAEGFYGCLRCKSMVARADSQIRFEGGYATFERYCVRNLACDMRVGKWQTRFVVSCAKCDAFVGELFKEATGTGDCLRVNSRCVHYTAKHPPPTSIMPRDSTFDADDEGDDSDGLGGSDFGDDEIFGK